MALGPGLQFAIQPPASPVTLIAIWISVLAGTSIVYQSASPSKPIVPSFATPWVSGVAAVATSFGSFMSVSSSTRTVM